MSEVLNPALLSFDGVVALVLQSLADLNEERPADDQIPLDVDTELFGPEAILDSLGLVSVIADVEMSVSDAVGHSIALMDDQALSQEESPFVSVRALANYVITLIGDRR